VHVVHRPVAALLGEAKPVAEVRRDVGQLVAGDVGADGDFDQSRDVRGELGPAEDADVALRAAGRVTAGRLAAGLDVRRVSGKTRHWRLL
jgi:hypothetical protein